MKWSRPSTPARIGIPPRERGYLTRAARTRTARIMSPRGNRGANAGSSSRFRATARLRSFPPRPAAKNPRLMWGIWCGTGFQPVLGPIAMDKMPVPRAGFHQFPHMSQTVNTARVPGFRLHRLMLMSRGCRDSDCLPWLGDYRGDHVLEAHPRSPGSRKGPLSCQVSRRNVPAWTSSWTRSGPMTSMVPGFCSSATPH